MKGIKMDRDVYKRQTFNCAPHHHRPMMEFMRDADTETNFHLEMEPELMTEWETNILCETPPGRIQIEVGVQSTHKKTLDAINRYNDWPYIQKAICPIIEACLLYTSRCV